MRKMIPYAVLGLALMLCDPGTAMSHAQLLAITVLFAAIASTLDGALRTLMRDHDPDAGTRFGVLVATAVGMVGGFGHVQLWRAMGAGMIHAQAMVLAMCAGTVFLLARLCGGVRAAAEAVRSAGWLRPVAAFVTAAALGGVLVRAPGPLVVVVTLAAARWFATVDGLDPDYVAAEVEASDPETISLEEPVAAPGNVTGPASPSPAAAGAARARVRRADAMPAAELAVCPRCARKVDAHVAACGECGAVEHPGCAGERCSVCGAARGRAPARAA